ncbi:MAG TPA: hypothetical protein VFS43_01710 [Polyangiaceae bacterium]|nr:hypothetical protein [Polyangiaceae bacterium]
MTPAAPLVVHRAPVEVERDPAKLESELDELSQRQPAGYVVRAAPFGFVFRPEPEMFYFVAIGSSLGMGIMLAEFAHRLPPISAALWALALAFWALCAAVLGLFVRSVLTRTEIVAEGGVIEVRNRLGRRVTRRRRYPANEVVAVLVVRPENGPERVLLAGPRHRVLAELYRAKVLDPASFPRWYADMVALVARHASARPEGPPSAGASAGRHH